MFLMKMLELLMLIESVEIKKKIDFFSFLCFSLIFFTISFPNFFPFLFFFFPKTKNQKKKKKEMEDEEDRFRVKVW